MSATVILDPCMQRASGIAGESYHGEKDGTYAFNGLGMWMLQRFPHQRGCWHVQLYIRGLFVGCEAVQDDFGDLIIVKV